MEKPIVFRNKNGKQLIGMLHLPQGKRKPPLVVLCHGFGGTKTAKRFVKLARVLEKNEIATFRFDFEGCGDSEGNFETFTIKKEVSDLVVALKFILKQIKVNKNKLAFVGHSLGAVMAALYVLEVKFSTRSLVFWAPAFDQKSLLAIWLTPKDFKKWQRQGYLIKKENKMGLNYLRENQDKDYSSILARIKVPILIIHGQKDDVVPLRFSRKLVKKYKNIKLMISPKADHKFEDYYDQQELIKKTVVWLKKHFKK